MPFNNLAYASERREHRDEVHFRTRVQDNAGRELSLVIVNISPNGLMARCETPLQPGVRLTFRLPDLKPIIAEVRWALGGRIGCEFERSIAAAGYYAVLTRLH